MADGLPIEAELYDRQALERLGLRGLLTVGDSSAYAPAMVVLRYTGAPDCGRRLGLVQNRSCNELHELRHQT